MENKEDQFNKYLDTVFSEGVHKNKKNLVFYLKTIFKDVDFQGKKVLDIGGGAGLLTFFAACCGAREVVCIEPEGDGGKTNHISKFNRLNDLLEYRNVTLEQKIFQEYELTGDKFDIIIMHNSINHLDEKACIRLLDDKKCENEYRDILCKIGRMTNSKGDIVICDCSRYNFFALIGVKNPFAPNIEWQKHQSPGVWVKLLKEAGFSNEKIIWLSFNTLGKVGRFFCGNKYASFFLNSHFCIKMSKS